MDLRTRFGYYTVEGYDDLMEKKAYFLLYTILTSQMLPLREWLLKHSAHAKATDMSRQRSIFSNREQKRTS